MRPVPAPHRLVALVASLVLVHWGLVSAQAPEGGPPTPGSTASPATRSYELPGHGTLALMVPVGWKESVSRPPGELPPTIGFEPPTGAEFQIAVTPIWGPPGMPAERFTPEDARSLAETQGRKILEQSVETDLALKEIKGPHAIGYIVALTDKTMVSRAPAEGEYRCVTQGVVLTGDLLVVVTVLTQEHGNEAVRAALEMIRTARLRP